MTTKYGKPPFSSFPDGFVVFPVDSAGFPPDSAGFDVTAAGVVARFGLRLLGSCGSFGCYGSRRCAVILNFDDVEEEALSDLLVAEE